MIGMLSHPSFTLWPKYFVTPVLNVQVESS
ncbi:hypothetical protein FHW16_003221 [Phyllobacterium myrsinacearum]|uniref:Uncharacterized protein n=1 Tax=Phyllobacterium myrsinacearum TaxID=28101 RepID=A0A839EKV6_9HYPH|nr:hypothetical protein [Phyllobacterium myrsinacearum]